MPPVGRRRKYVLKPSESAALPPSIGGGSAPGFIDLLATGVLFAVGYSFYEILGSSGTPYLIGGDGKDWAQIAGGIGAYAALYVCVAVVLYGLVRLVARKRRPYTFVVVGVACAAAWLVAMAVHLLGAPMTLLEDLLFGGMIGVVGLIALLLHAARVLPVRGFAGVWALAGASGIAALHVASRLFFMSENRPWLAGAVAVAWALTAGVFGTVLALVARRSSMLRPIRALLILLACALLPIALGFGRNLAVRFREPLGFQMVFVTCDALRADYCSVYGGRTPTPNLDRIGAEGTVFDRCYSLAPWTPPSICGLWSSKYPQSMSPGAEKSQWIDILGSRANVMAYWLDGDGRSELDRMRDEGILTAAFISNPVLVTERWLLRGFGQHRFFEHLAPEQRGLFWRFPALHQCLGRFVPSVLEERPFDSTRVCRQYAMEFIRQNRDREFLLWVHLMDPHDPYDPPERFRTMTGDWPVFSPADGGFGSIDADTVHEGNLTDEQRRYIQSLYEGEIRYLDEVIGDIQGELARCSPEKAFLCVGADHGEEFWDHGEWAHGQSLYDELIHVPLIFWGPYIKAQRIAAPVSNADILPTITHLLGRERRAEWRGQSLLSYLRGRGEPPERRPCFSQGTAAFEDDPMRSVVSGDMKFIEGLTTGDKELYDLERDPGELADLAGAQPGEADRLQTLVLDWVDTFPAFIADFGEPEMDDAAREQALMQLQALGYLGD